MGYYRKRALGDVAPGDFVAIFSAQRNEAARAFDVTSFNQPGRTDTFYPNITGTYAVRLIDYWQREAKRVLGSKSIHDKVATEIFGSPAHYAAWRRKVEALGSLTMIAIRAKAVIAGNNLLSQEDAKRVWVAVDDVVLPMRAIKETPSQWELLKEAVAETVPSLPGLPSLPDFGGALRVALYGSLAFGAWWLWSKSKGGR